MQKNKLKYHFHNPNTERSTTDVLMRIIVEANSYKFREAIRCSQKELNSKPELVEASGV